MGQSCVATATESKPKVTRPEILHKIIRQICLEKMGIESDDIPEAIEKHLIPHYKVDWRDRVPLLKQKRLSFDDQKNQINIQSPSKNWTYAVDPNNYMRLVLNNLTSPQSLSLSFDSNKYNPLDRARRCLFFSPDDSMIGVTIKNKETNKLECLMYKTNDLATKNPQPVAGYNLDIDAGNYPYLFACKFNKNNRFCAIASQRHIDVYDMITGDKHQLAIEPNNMEFSHNGNYLIISNDTNKTVIYDLLTKKEHHLNEQYLTMIDQDTLITRRPMLTKTHVISHNLTTGNESIVDCNGTDIATMYGERYVVTNSSNSVQILHFTNPHPRGNNNRYYLLCKNKIREITDKRFKNRYLINCCLLSDNGKYVALNTNNSINMYHINNKDNELEYLASHTNKVPNSQLMHINWNGQNISLLDTKSHTLYTYGYRVDRGFTGITHAIKEQSDTISQGRIFWKGQILNQNQTSCMDTHDRQKGIAYIIDLVQMHQILEAPYPASTNHATVITNNNAEYAISSLDTKL